MIIVSSQTQLEADLVSLQADRALLASIANTLRKPISSYEEHRFVVVAERVDHEMERLAYRLAISED